LKELIAGEMNDDVKYKILAFIIGDIISEENLKTIPLEHLMHVIVTMQMVKNNSMTLNEARALTQAVLKSDNLKLGFAYPKSVNVRAFRVSALYEELFGILLMILSPLGMTEFIVSIFK
jgi:hypothetical protein